MLGARGVGKTSLLTAMYDQFDDTIGQAGLHLVPDEETSARLNQRLGELKALGNDFESMPGLEGTEEPQYFYFGLGQPGKPPSLQLIFQDFPGGYLDPQKHRDKEAGANFVDQTMTECVAVLIAIDTPALMEDNGRWNDLINRPKQIRDIFSRTYVNLKEPRLVILAPVRCEKYVQNQEEAGKLLQQIKEKYESLLNYFRHEELKDKIVCVVTPVQTLGSIFFSKLEIRNKQPNFIFYKISPTAGYKPQDCDQPIRYILRFVLKMYFDKKGDILNIFDFISHLLGKDEYIRDAVYKCALKAKSSNGGFEIIQGQEKLKINQKGK